MGRNQNGKRITADQLEKLVGRARNGDLAAFEELYWQYARTVLNYAYYMTGSHERAETATRDSFTAAYKGLRSLRTNCQFESWLLKIAHQNICREDCGLATRVEEQERTDAAPVDRNEATHPSIRRIIDHLPERYKQALILSTVAGCSYETIAKVMGSSAAAVKSDVHGALVSVRDRMNGNEQRGWAAPLGSAMETWVK